MKLQFAIKVIFQISWMLILAFNLQAQTWEFTAGGDQYDFGYDIQQTTDEGFIVVGSTQSFATDSVFQHAIVIKLDKNGAEEWTKILAYPNNPYSGCHAVQQLNDGGYLLPTITYPNNLFFNINLVKLNESGEEEWSKILSDSLKLYPYDIEKTNDGNFVITGQYYNYPNNAIDIFIFKVDEFGNVVWESFYGGENVDQAKTIKETSDGGFIIGGALQDVTFADEDFLMVKMDSAGNMEWVKIEGLVNNITGLGDEANSAIQTSDGGFATAGYWDGGESLVVFKTDSAGNDEWEVFFEGGLGLNLGGYLLNNQDGDIAIIGNDPDNFHITVMTTEGNMLWQKILENKIGFDGILGLSACLTNDNGYAIVGSIRYPFPNNQYDLYVVRTDEFGNITSQSNILIPEAKVSVFPNPSMDIVEWAIVNPSEQEMTLEVLSIDGRTLLEKKFLKKTSISSRAMNLSEGTYLFKISDKSGKTVETGQFLIVR